MNWIIIITIILLYAGLYCILMFPRNDNDLQSLQQRNKNIRVLGWVLLGSGCALLIYTYSYSFSSNMPSDCDLCQRYVLRSKALHPYRREEYSELARLSKACNDCSKQCSSDVQLLRKHGIKDSRRETHCIEMTKGAMTSRKELKRLEPDVRRGGVNAWATSVRHGGYPVVDPFPKIPK